MENYNEIKKVCGSDIAFIVRKLNGTLVSFTKGIDQLNSHKRINLYIVNTNEYSYAVEAAVYKRLKLEKQEKWERKSVFVHSMFDKEGLSYCIIDIWKATNET